MEFLRCHRLCWCYPMSNKALLDRLAAAVVAKPRPGGSAALPDVLADLTALHNWTQAWASDGRTWRIDGSSPWRVDPALLDILATRTAEESWLSLGEALEGLTTLHTWAEARVARDHLAIGIRSIRRCWLAWLLRWRQTPSAAACRCRRRWKASKHFTPGRSCHAETRPSGAGPSGGIAVISCSATEAARVASVPARSQAAG